ncbi:MAG TPA: universal stress protein [Vicinamibacterales bacterium]|nr:universal stress protein [Vicinamibacterales bacterium]
MITLEKILVPTDFSECSDAAVRYGRALAAAFGATLHLLHVVQDPYTQPWAAEAFPAPLGDLLEQWQAQARQRMAALLPEAEWSKVLATALVGSPFVEILRYAEEQRIDLIVIGTHGRGPLGHMLLGSVTERIVRKAPCPVLTVRHPQHGFVQ